MPMTIRPKYKKGMRLYWDGIDRDGKIDDKVRRVFVNEVWWGGKYGNPRFFVPKFYKGQKVRNKSFGDITTIESVHNWKSLWECDRSDMEHGGYVEYYDEPSYHCENEHMEGDENQSELEAIDDTKPTERDILYDVLVGHGMSMLIRQPNLHLTKEDAENSRALVHGINSLNDEPSQQTVGVQNERD